MWPRQQWTSCVGHWALGATWPDRAAGYFTVTSAAFCIIPTPRYVISRFTVDFTLYLFIAHIYFMPPSLFTSHRMLWGFPPHLAPRWWWTSWPGSPRCCWRRSCRRPPPRRWWRAGWACLPSPRSAAAGCRCCSPRWGEEEAPRQWWCTPETPSGPGSPRWGPPPAAWWTGRLWRKGEGVEV